MKRFPAGIVVLVLFPLGCPAAASERAVPEGARGMRPQDIDARFLRVSPADPSLLAGTSLQMRLLPVLPHREPVDVSEFVTRWVSSRPTLAPTDGPLDYDGDGNTTGTNVSADLIRQDHPSVPMCPSGVTDVLNGHTDWGPAPGQSGGQR